MSGHILNQPRPYLNDLNWPMKKLARSIERLIFNLSLPATFCGLQRTF
jgi:hypothetical protein